MGRGDVVTSTASLAVALVVVCAIGCAVDGGGDPVVGVSGGALVAPNTPTIIEPSVEGQVVNAQDVHMEIAPFVDGDPGQIHLATDWELVATATLEVVWSALGVTDPLLKVHIHLGDGTFQGSYAGRTALVPSLAYQLRARVEDNSGDPATEWSAWAVRNFLTAAAIVPQPGAPSWAVRQAGYRVELVATGFQLPVNIAFIPTATGQAAAPLFYVSELYGNIKVVTGDGTTSSYATGLLNFNPTGVFPGSGEQGLAGLVVEPTTGDLFASLLYDDGIGSHYPKVIRLHSTDGGFSAASQSLVLAMPGELMGQSHQISNLSIGPDGKLFVHVGDGFDTTTGQNLDSFRGKILRLNLDGSAPPDNPFYNAGDGITARDYVFAYGLRNPFGGAWRDAEGAHYEVENGPSVDRFARIVRGMNYGYDGSDASMAIGALYNWSPAHAPINIAFIQQDSFHYSGFPAATYDAAYVTESGPTFATGPQSLGKRIVQFTLNPGGSLASGPTPLVEYTGAGDSTCAGLAAGPDGLYFTDLYPESTSTAANTPGANVFRIRYVGSTTAPPPGTGTGLTGSYYDNIDFTGASVTRTDPQVNFNWGSGSPAPAIGPDTFSARWTGQVQPLYSESYTFTTISDDGVRLWVNGQLVIDSWINQAATSHSGTITLAAGTKYDLRMEYYENGGLASAQLYWSSVSQANQIIPTSQLYPAAATPPPTTPPPGTGTGLTGTYYDNVDFTGVSITRTDPQVSFNWGSGSPDPAIGPDTFSVRWTGQVQPLYSESYTFTTISDDGVRLWVNGQLVIDSWINQAATSHSGTISLAGGTKYDLRMEYYENGGLASAQLYWASVSQASQIIPTSQLYPAAATPPPTTPPPGAGTGLTGTYYDNVGFTGASITRTDPQVDFNWGSGSPDPAIGPDTFSARWTGQVQPLYSETYTFSTRSDDGARLWVDGQLVVDSWIDQSATSHSGVITLAAGTKYTIQMEYYENGGLAVAQLYWSSASQPTQIIPTPQLYP
jgi:glucose/arabinose dehydrogenase